MKLFTISTLGLALFAGVGCASRTPVGETSGNSALDISPAPAAPAKETTYQPAAAPTQLTSVTPSGNSDVTLVSSTSYSGGSSYTVKKGDTLYGIARARYGDAKQWKKIAAANPGISPSKLKVGQTIIMP